MAPRSVRFGVRSWKLSNVGQSLDGQNLLSQAPSCFGRHVKQLVLVAFVVVSTHQPALGLRGGLCPFSLCEIHKEVLCSSSDDDDYCLIFRVT
jgi:hypothetical protein